jgi:hypothetical protein
VAALVANPTRDADVEVELEIRLELSRAAGETVCDAAGETRALRCKHRDELVVRVTLVQEQGFADFGRELELRREGVALRIARRVVAEEIEPALAHGDELRSCEQRAQRRRCVRVELGGVVRVHASRRE